MSNSDNPSVSTTPTEPFGLQPYETEQRRLEEDERWQLVSRIVESRVFSKSLRLREFLLFTTRSALTGHAKDLTEVVIAHRIFGRDEAFVPLDDSVVRGSARQLRAKLKEYFETEGAHEQWQLDIPKGGYVPVFVRHEAPPAVTQPVPAAGPAPQRKGWITTGMIAATALNVVFLFFNLWSARSQQSSASGRPQSSLLSAFVPATTAPTRIVVSDFSLALMLVGGEQISLDDYSRSDYHHLQSGVQVDGRLQKVFDVLLTHRLTRLGDLNVVAGVQKSLGTASPLVIRDARDVNSRDFKTGRHILLGNPYCTPWIELFEDRLNFPDVRLEDVVGFRNLSPKTGEPAAFTVSTDEARREEGRGYARLAYVPNLSGKEGVLLISGVNMVTMEAAGEFAADAATFPELMRALGKGPKDKLPYFEAILETHAVDNTPRKSSLRTIRLIESASGH